MQKLVSSSEDKYSNLFVMNLFISENTEMR